MAGVSCPSCVPSQLLVHPQTTYWWDSVRNRKDFDCVNPALQQLKNPSVDNNLPVPNAKHNTVQDTKQKINSIPEQTSTSYFYNWYIPIHSLPGNCEYLQRDKISIDIKIIILSYLHHFEKHFLNFYKLKKRRANSQKRNCHESEKCMRCEFNSTFFILAWFL